MGRGTHRRTAVVAAVAALVVVGGGLRADAQLPPLLGGQAQDPTPVTDPTATTTA
ncbi:MAG: hypothetical protein H0W25_00455, partial [Acidimicrobiia bacterium]|nr:hypothetical protein [Acidimicrobiia bacterium]